MNRTLMVAAVLTLLTPSFLCATQGSVYLGIAGAGGKVDLSAAGGGKDDIAEPGPTIGGQLLYDFSKSVAAGIDLNYTHFGEKDSTKLSPIINSTLNLKTTVVMAVAKWTALPDQKFRPYLLGGLGFHNSAFKYEAAPVFGLAWLDTGTAEKRALVDDSETGMAAAFGVGLDLDLNESLFLGGEARFTYLGDVTWQATSLGQAGGLQSVKGDNSMFQLLIKLGFKFGGGSESAPKAIEPAKNPAAI